MGFILFLVANLLFLPLTVLNVLAVLYKNIKVYGFLNVINIYFKQTALDLDRFANHNFRTLWNTVLITKDGYQFGLIQETISSALGKNQVKQTLTTTGKILCFILNTLDNNHCINSIDNTIKPLK